MKKILFFLLVVCSACNLEEEGTQDPVFCTEEARPGLEITINSATSDTLLLTGLIVVAKDNDYIETLQQSSGSNVFYGAFERTGSYYITVSVNGYEIFTSITPIIVDKDMCHVITEYREVKVRFD